MAEETKQDEQKTIVAFVVGLLIGGLLVWAFSGPDKHDHLDVHHDDDTEEVEEMDDEMSESEDDMEAEAPALQVGSGNVEVPDQAASRSITMDRAEYPVSEGWIGVRTYQNETLGNILGVVRFSESQGLIPENIELLAPTVSGQEYAVVIFEEDGDFDFNLRYDMQLDRIFDTFVAQ